MPIGTTTKGRNGRKDGYVGGSSCHQCKSRRNPKELTYCTSSLDRKTSKNRKKARNCRKKYCEHCLKKFYKETPTTIEDPETWKCPACRKICCCAACRRKDQKEKDAAKDNPTKNSSNSNNTNVSTSSNKPKTTYKAASRPRIKKKRARPQTYTKRAKTLTTHDDTYMEEEEEDFESGMTENEKRNVVFSKILDYAYTDPVRKHVSYILQRIDITEAQKIKTLSDLLRRGISSS